jgi:hypothetical protein
LQSFGRQICVQKELAFEYAERNCIDDRFRKEIRLLERTGATDFAKDKIYQSGCPKNAAYEELYALV